MMALRGGATVKRSVRVAGHPTSVSLEEAFWQGLKDIAEARATTLNALIGEIDAARVEHLPDGTAPNLSSAIRVYVLEWYKGRAPADTPRP